MKKKLKFFVRILIGLSILFLLFYKVGFEEVYSTIIKINVFYLFLFFFFYVLGIVIGASNLKILLNFYKKMPSLLKVLKYYFFSWCFGLFVLSKFGEFSIVYFFKKEGIPMGRGLAITLIDKYITVILYGIFASLFIFIFFGIKKTMLLIAILAITTAITVFVLLSKTTRNIIKKYILKKYAKKFKKFSSTFFAYLSKGKRYLFQDSLLTIVRLAVNASKTYFLFLGFGVHIPLIYIMMVYSVTSLSILIPISIGGLGVRQSVGLFLYILLGVPSAIIMSNYAIVIATNYIIGTTGFIYLLFSKKNRLF